MTINVVQATPYQTTQDTEASQDNLPYATRAAMPHAAQPTATVEMIKQKEKKIGGAEKAERTTATPKFTRTMSISTRPIRK